jgi:hypothetical protein
MMTIAPRLIRHLILLALLLSPFAAADTPSATQPSQAATRPARNYCLTRQAVAGVSPLQWVFVVVTPEGAALVTAESKLQWSIEQIVPAGSTLEWAPGCLRTDGQPLGTAEAEATLKSFCLDHKIEFKHIPSG